MAKRLETTAVKKAANTVRLYIPNTTTFEVWEGDICRLKLSSVKEIILDNGRERTQVKMS